MNSSLTIEEEQRLKDIPWVKDMLNTLQERLARTVLCFTRTAEKLSSNKSDLESWVNVFQEQFQENCEVLLDDIKGLETETLNKVEKALTKIQEMCKMLQIDMPDLGSEKLSLYEELHILKKHIAEYKTIIEKRKKEMNDLLSQQDILCKSLGKSPKRLTTDPLPSRTELKQLHEHVEELESERFHRLEKYLDLKNEIVQAATSLKYNPISEFEKRICDEKDDTEFCVSDVNMDQLECFRDKLSIEMNRVLKEIDELWASINHHWNLLDIDMMERDVFKRENSSISYEVLNSLREEVNRCQQLKKANIKVFVDRLRNELKDLWLRCRCSESVKTDFGFFYTTCYTEDLLELHENEIKIWSTFYEENKDLILLLEKHGKLWRQMMKLEENATAANRYNNRGGQLLKEERERNKLSKSIPIIEGELQEMAERYESGNGKPFLTFGQTVLEYLSYLHEERENRRKVMLSARKQKRDVTDATCTTSQVASSSKRKLLTPMMENNKLTRLTPRKVTPEPKKIGSKHVPRITVTRVSTDRKKRMEKIKRRSLLGRVQKHKNDTVSTEYGAFENELSARVDCRSTMNPLAEELPAPTHLAGTIKTPSKSKLTLSATPSRPYTSKAERCIPRTPVTPKDSQRQLSTAKSPLKLIF